MSSKLLYLRPYKISQEGFYMFKPLWDKFTKTDSNAEADCNSRYSSQAEMLKSLGRENEPALCNSLTNLFTNYQITGTKKYDIFSKNNGDAYISAVLYEDHQKELRLNGLDGRHSAFVDTQTPYCVHQIPAKEAVNLKVETILPTPGHAMLTYPVDGDNVDDYHQVYLGRLPKSKSTCVSFDSEIKGGTKQGDCQELLSDFLKQMSVSEDSNRPPKVFYAATSSFFADKKINSRNNSINNEENNNSGSKLKER